MTFAGSHGLSKLDYAKRLAATLAYRIVEDRDSAGLAVFDDELRGLVPPKGSKNVLVDLVRELNRAENSSRTEVGGILTQISSRMKRRGFVILISDLLTDEESFLSGIHQLACAGHNVIVFQVLDHDELTFPYDQSTRFIGLESDDEVVVEPGRLRQEYLDVLGGMIDRYRVNLGNAGVDHAFSGYERIGWGHSGLLSGFPLSCPSLMKSIAALAFLASVVLLKADQVMFSNGATRIYEKVSLDAQGHFAIDGKTYSPQQVLQWITDHPATVGPAHEVLLKDGSLYLGKLLAADRDSLTLRIEPMGKPLVISRKRIREIVFSRRVDRLLPADFPKTSNSGILIRKGGAGALSIGGCFCREDRFFNPVGEDRSAFPFLA